MRGSIKAKDECARLAPTTLTVCATWVNNLASLCYLGQQPSQFVLLGPTT